MIRVIIIDDEPSAVNVLSLLLKKKCRDEVEIVATSNSPFDAKPLIEQYKPDLVFLDIEMPGLTGIDVARSFDRPNFRIVFVTAYDAYAIEAFELSAIDYLLKPIGADKVVRVIQKIKESMDRKQDSMFQQLQQFERLLQLHTGNDNKIGISTSDKIIFLNIAEILYCEAQGAYTHIHLQDGKKILASKMLGDYESQLSNQHFFRIHHSYLINLNRVREFQRFDGGCVMMENNIRLDVSTRKRKDFLEAMESFVVNKSR